MKNMPTTLAEQLRRLSKRASIIERQCRAATKLDDESIMLDVMCTELDGVYAAISQVLDGLPMAAEQTMCHLSDVTLDALCSAEQDSHTWIVQQLTGCGTDLYGFLSAQERHSRTKLANLIAEREYRHTKHVISVKKVEQLSHVSA